MQAVRIMFMSIKSRVFEKQEYLTVKLLNFGGRILSFIRSSLTKPKILFSLQFQRIKVSKAAGND